ncbi:MAG: type II toxin-antitoxin system Phd/YefM family antitoxin, partial [Acidobacteriota bacterium]
MHISRDIQPLNTFKRETNKIIKQLEETGEPVVLTVHGKAKVVVQDAAAYQGLLDRTERMKDRLEAIAGIRRGLASMKRGEGRAAEEVFADLFKEFGISE